MNQILFYKLIWYIKWRTLPMPVCSGLYGPRGSRTHPKPKTGYPSYIAEVEHIPFFETPQEPKMLRALNVWPLDRFARYNRSHLDDTSKNFSFLKSSSVSLFWANNPKSGSQSTLFVFQKLNHFQWSSSRGFWA